MECRSDSSKTQIPSLMRFGELRLKGDGGWGGRGGRKRGGRAVPRVGTSMWRPCWKISLGGGMRVYCGGQGGGVMG